jgi:hypothetical protein
MKRKGFRPPDSAEEKPAAPWVRCAQTAPEARRLQKQCAPIYQQAFLVGTAPVWLLSGRIERIAHLLQSRHHFERPLDRRITSRAVLTEGLARSNTILAIEGGLRFPAANIS